eukprot:9856184-Alexandrium_andersonii.AAC.1
MEASEPQLVGRCCGPAGLHMCPSAGLAGVGMGWARLWPFRPHVAGLWSFEPTTGRALLWPCQPAFGSCCGRRRVGDGRARLWPSHLHLPSLGRPFSGVELGGTR